MARDSAFGAGSFERLLRKERYRRSVGMSSSVDQRNTTAVVQIYRVQNAQAFG